MPSILDRMKTTLASTKAPEVTQVFERSDVVKDTVVVQPLVEPKVIKRNEPGMPVAGFTLDTLALELGVVLEKAMQKAGVSSVNSEVFGIFSHLGIVPKGFTKIMDEYIGQEFYVLKNANRMTEIFKPLVKALNNSNAEVISFPYLVETTLELPYKFSATKGEFEYRSLTTVGLYLTPKEITSLNYKFIKEIQFHEKNSDVQNSVDLLVMKIDREEWRAAPYRT